MKQSLQEIFNEIGNLTTTDYGANDKGGQIHTYLETYDKLFAPYRSSSMIMEIGLAVGDSIKLFDRYFENTHIVGVDISVVFTPFLSEKDNMLEIIEADATKESFLEHIEGKMFDIIIEDASHQTQDQIDTFNLLKHKMNKGGLFIIEDILALDQERGRYEALHSNCEIIDMRHITNRFDNVLIIYRF